MTTIEAQLGGLTFSTEVGAKYTIRALDGWYGPAPEKSGLEERPNADGAFGQEVFYRAARPITLSGLVLGDGDEGFADWLALSSVMAAGRPEALSVTDPTGTLSSVVKVVGSGSFISPIVGGVASYALALVAFDPVKYSEPVLQSVAAPTAAGGLQYNLHDDGVLEYGAGGNLGRVTVSNVGTARTFPKITVSGELVNGFRVTRLDTGQAVQYDQTVPVGGSVVVDFRTGSVLVDGLSDASAFVSRAEFFGVEAGGQADIQFTPLGSTAGDPQMTVSFASGWW